MLAGLQTLLNTAEEETQYEPCMRDVTYVTSGYKYYCVATNIRILDCIFLQLQDVLCKWWFAEWVMQL